MSRRGMLLPTHRWSAAGFGFTLAVAWRLKSASRARSQDVARLGAREAQRGAALLDRQGAGGLALVRRPRGIAVDHLDALEMHVELVRGDLRQRGAYALTELDLPGEDRDRAARIDAQPRVEHAVGVEAARERSGSILSPGQTRSERESDDEPARSEKVATRDARGRRRLHDRVSA